LPWNVILGARASLDSGLRRFNDGHLEERGLKLSVVQMGVTSVRSKRIGSIEVV
jgi:hypothetical protein